MKSKKKVFLTVLCAAALVVASVLGTMAYLTAKTGTVTNTFTAGNVAITLDEAKVDQYGAKEFKDDGETLKDRVMDNAYKLIPGHTYVKDPTVHVADGSETSWLFVKVVDEISDIEASKTVAAQMTEKGWTAVTGADNVYAYNTTVTAKQDIVVFDNFTLTDNAEVDDYAGKTITVMAYAVQADGFATAADAWVAAPTDWATE